MLLLLRRPNLHSLYTLRSKHFKHLVENYLSTGKTLPVFKPNIESTRPFVLSAALLEREPSKPPSKVEATVKGLQKKKQEEQIQKKKPLVQKVKDELLHYYHGFRLLFIDVGVSSGLLWRVLRGETLTRREYRLLTRTVGDLFRLVPFTVFIVVPFMEFLLPLFVKFFPGMLPSTFETSSVREDKLKKGLKAKLEMAKFLQGTLDDMALQDKNWHSDSAKEFKLWFNKVRTSGEQVSTEEIMKFSKLFEDHITLDSLTRSQLLALCRLLDVHTLGTNNFLRFQLRMKLRSLAADDRMIKKEGVDSMTFGEVQQACRARGMRTVGVSERRLRAQLEQWLDLSLDKRLPPSLLLLSRALMLPEAIPTSDKLKATISALPESVAKQTEHAIGEKEGKIDNKVRADIIKEEVKIIKEERAEMKKTLEEDAKKPEPPQTVVEAATPKPPALPKRPPVPEPPPAKDLEDSKVLEIIETAIDSSDAKKFVVEKEKIETLKSDMQDYKEDLAELSKTVASDPQVTVRESTAARRLFKSVNRIVAGLDKVLVDLEAKERQLRRDLEVGGVGDEAHERKRQELLRIDDVATAIQGIKDVSDKSKLEQITNLLKKMDLDQDGSVKIEDILKVIKIIGKENVKLDPKQIEEIMQLIDKEEILKVEDKIEKALQKDKEAKGQQPKSQAVQQPKMNPGKRD